MKVLKNPFNSIERLGRWAYPKTLAGRRAADMTTIVLMIIMAVIFFYSLFLR